MARQYSRLPPELDAPLTPHEQRAITRHASDDALVAITIAICQRAVKQARKGDASAMNWCDVVIPEWRQN